MRCPIDADIPNSNFFQRNDVSNFSANVSYCFVGDSDDLNSSVSQCLASGNQIVERIDLAVNDTADEDIGRNMLSSVCISAFDDPEYVLKSCADAFSDNGNVFIGFSVVASYSYKHPNSRNHLLVRVAETNCRGCFIGVLNFDFVNEDVVLHASFLCILVDSRVLHCLIVKGHVELMNSAAYERDGSKSGDTKTLVYPWV